MANLYLNGNTLDLNYFLIKFLYGKGEPAITSDFMFKVDFFSLCEVFMFRYTLFNRTFFWLENAKLGHFLWGLILWYRRRKNCEIWKKMRNWWFECQRMEIKRLWMCDREWYEYIHVSAFLILSRMHWHLLRMATRSQTLYFGLMALNSACFVSTGIVYPNQTNNSFEVIFQFTQYFTTCFSEFLHYFWK